MKENFKQYCFFFSKKDSVIIHDARIPKTTKLMVNVARDYTPTAPYSA